MTQLYLLDAAGGFTVGDTSTGATSYAYPSSSHATAAKRNPVKVAREMLAEANAQAALHAAWTEQRDRGVPDYIADYHMRNFDRMARDGAGTLPAEG